ncbi:hypothetical protein PHMEG_00013113 [Phytophthora megakarya]|uniref:Uncharacterized protein n=1 Tax=Phytophthora megakarya TaxID=4795 RepID=A0A225W740_9STRA|nr:hypothetical protein PHMEG_00013113 [Phytophthora megakarya]
MKNRAGVRLCVKEELVQLPDEETVLLSGRGLSRVKHVYYVSSTLIISVNPTARCLKVNAAVDCLGWTRISLGDSGVIPAAIKVVNISNSTVTIDWRTEVAQVVENVFVPRAGRYVRVSTRRYQECQTLIYENTKSTKAQARESQR